MLTGRLIRLRAVEETDAERCHAWVNDREVTQFMGMRFPVSLMQEREWVSRGSKRESEAIFAIDTLDGTHIGNAGLHWGADLPHSRGAELGIMIGDKAHWSKGYGQDAIRTLLRYGFDELNLHRICLRVFEGNARGIGCYERCGFQHEGRERDGFFRDGAYVDVLVMSILEDEWRGGAQSPG
jgi:RimJ/RimL family protein N-acetyltransferase